MVSENSEHTTIIGPQPATAKGRRSPSSGSSPVHASEKKHCTGWILSSEDADRHAVTTRVVIAIAGKVAIAVVERTDDGSRSGDRGGACGTIDRRRDTHRELQGVATYAQHGESGSPPDLRRSRDVEG